MKKEVNLLVMTGTIKNKWVCLEDNSASFTLSEHNQKIVALSESFAKLIDTTFNNGDRVVVQGTLENGLVEIIEIAKLEN